MFFHMLGSLLVKSTCNTVKDKNSPGKLDPRDPRSAKGSKVWDLAFDMDDTPEAAITVRIWVRLTFGKAINKPDMPSNKQHKHHTIW